MQTYDCGEIYQIKRAAAWPSYRKSQFRNISARAQASKTLKSHHFAWRIRAKQLETNQIFQIKSKLINGQINTACSKDFKGFGNDIKTQASVALVKDLHEQASVALKSAFLSRPKLNEQLKIANPVYLAILGLGSNIEPEIWRYKKLAARMRNDSRIGILASSAFVINKAFGYLEQKNFTNAVLVVKTSLPPRKLLKWAMHEEKVFKRIRSFKNAPRTLDIDLLYCSGLCRQSADLRLPHLGSFLRSSVFVPLALI